MIFIYLFYLLLSASVVFLIFYSSLGRSVKAVALTTLVLLGVFTQEHYISQLGKPIEGYPSSEFVYIHHIAEGEDITLWVWDEETGHRLYAFPYSQDTAEELEKAKEKTKGGQTQSGKFKPKDDGRSAPGLLLDSWKGPSSERTK